MRNSEIPRPGQVKEVTSLANPVVKDIKALALKKRRDETNSFIAEGLKLVIDALDTGWKLSVLVIAKAATGGGQARQTMARAVASGALVLEASESVIASITRRENPQGVIGVFGQRWEALGALHPTKEDVYVALDRVRDPGNLGTIVRTADAVGAKGVILIGETTDPFSMEAVRASMGSIFNVPVFKTSEPDFLSFRTGFKGLLAGTHLKGSADYRSVDYRGSPVVLLMGNEQAGLPDSLAGACDRLIRIPQAGKADSLNLAVATGVALFEIRRHALKV